MACKFLRADRNQPFLLPPDLRDWLPPQHLAWFILDVVDQLDLAAFYRAHRDDGHGHPAYDPKLLLGVLLYGYCLGVRSSRQLERRCIEDIAFRVLAANHTPDHVNLDAFTDRAHATRLGLAPALQLADAFDTSRHAAIRRYVEASPRACALLVIGKFPVHPGGRRSLRVLRGLESATFHARYGPITSCLPATLPVDEVPLARDALTALSGQAPTPCWPAASPRPTAAEARSTSTTRCTPTPTGPSPCCSPIAA